MKGRVKVTAELQDGGTFEDELPVEYPPEQIHTVIYQALGAINKVGGLIKRGNVENVLDFIPMAAVKHLTVELSTVVGANLQDLGQELTPKAPLIR